MGGSLSASSLKDCVTLGCVCCTLMKKWDKRLSTALSDPLWEEEHTDFYTDYNIGVQVSRCVKALKRRTHAQMHTHGFPLNNGHVSFPYSAHRQIHPQLSILMLPLRQILWLTFLHVSQITARHMRTRPFKVKPCDCRRPINHWDIKQIQGVGLLNPSTLPQLSNVPRAARLFPVG